MLFFLSFFLSFFMWPGWAVCGILDSVLIWNCEDKLFASFLKCKTCSSFNFLRAVVWWSSSRVYIYIYGITISPKKCMLQLQICPKLVLSAAF